MNRERQVQNLSPASMREIRGGLMPPQGWRLPITSEQAMKLVQEAAQDLPNQQWPKPVEKQGPTI
jgi:hypothetical protein